MKKHYVKFYSLEEFTKNPDVTFDISGDLESKNMSFFIFKEHIGEVVDILSDYYLTGDTSRISSLKWAIEKTITKEENPEYFL